MDARREPMIRPLEDDEVGDEVRAIFRINSEKGYQDDTFVRVLAHRPGRRRTPWRAG